MVKTTGLVLRVGEVVMVMDPPSDLIQSVSRAVRILEVVGSAPDGLAPKVVARRCGLRLSTVYHLVRTLCYEGYLTRRPNGDYALGVEIADRFRDLAASLARPPEALPVLRHVAGTTGHSVYLARFVDGRVTLTHTVEAPQSPHLEDLVPGFDEAAHATALGKALLSTLDSGERRTYVDEVGLRPFTDATVTEPAALEHELRAVTDGVFSERGQYREPVACLAVLVPTTAPEHPWWALGMSVERAAFSERWPALRRVLTAAAEDLAA